MGRILDLLRALVSSVVYRGRDGTRKLELRAIHGRLRGCKPALFRPRGKALLPGLAVRLMQLSRSLDPLRAIFRQTLSHEDAEAARRFRDWLVEARLPGGMDQRRISFSYKEIKRQITPGASVDLPLKSIGEQFNRYMSTFGGTVYVGFDAAMAETMRLAGLARFDFGRLLRRFDPRFEGDRTDYRHDFSEVPGEEAIDELLDLYFIVARMQLGEGVVRNVCSLASRVFRDERYDPDAVTQAVDRVRASLLEVLPPPVLLDLIRAVREDAAYAPKVDQAVEEYLAGFKRRVTEEYERDRERIAREAGRAALDADVKALFEGIELLELKGYREEESAVLLRRGMDGYDLVFPLRVLKSFALARYENRLMDPVKQLLVEGAFRDRRFQESLSAAVLACEAVRGQIEEFEQSFGDGGRFSMRVINRSLDAHQRGKAAVSVELRRVVRAVNKQARAVLEEGSGAYYRLGMVLREALGDYKIRAPEHIVNIRVIAGDRNAAFVAALTQGYDDIRRLLQIVKQFAVPQADKRGGVPAAGAGEEPAGAGEAERPG